MKNKWRLLHEREMNVHVPTTQINTVKNKYVVITELQKEITYRKIKKRKFIWFGILSAYSQKNDDYYKVVVMCLACLVLFCANQSQNKVPTYTEI